MRPSSTPASIVSAITTTPKIALLSLHTLTPGHQAQIAERYEKALGAALSDDLRAPEVDAAARSGWTGLQDYDVPQPLPDGVDPLAAHVSAPQVLTRRLGQIGLVARGEGAALQAQLQPGQRLVSRDGDLWRWDGFRAGAEDAPSAAALRLQQLNRLVQLKRDLEDVGARADGARQAHETIVRAYAAGDRETLKPLLTPHVMASFEGGLAAREARGETEEAEFLRQPGSGF